MRPIPPDWHEPPWSAPLDAERLARLVPESATMTGQFLAAVAGLAQERGVRLTTMRPKYTSFSTYPLREHCELLIETARKLFPSLSLREALRKIGRGAPHVLLQSVVGRVVFGSAEGPYEILRAMAKSYSLHMRPCTVEVIEINECAAVVRASDIHNFLDSHNVGVFEGVLRYSHVQGSVKIHAYDRTTADMLCTWSR